MSTHERRAEYCGAPAIRVCRVAALCTVALLGGAAATLATTAHTGSASGGGREFAYCTAAGVFRLYQYRVAQDGALRSLKPPYIGLSAVTRPPFAAPDHRSFYVPSKNAVLQYRIRPDGTLTPLDPATVPTGSLAGHVFAADGRFLYVGDDESAVIYQYAVHSGGALRPLAPPRVRTGHGAWCVGVILSPDGQTLYSLNGDCTIGQFRVGANGRLSPLSPDAAPAAPSGQGIFAPDLVLGPGGHYAYAIADLRNQPEGFADHLLIVFRVCADGTLESVSSRAAPPMGDLQVRGRTLFARLGLGRIDQYNIAASGQLVPGLQIHGPANGSALVFTPRGRYAYQVGDAPGINRYRCAPDGSLTPLSQGPVVPTWGKPAGVYVDPSGRFLYAATQNNWGPAGIGQFRIGKDGQLTPLIPPGVTMPFDNNLTIIRLPARPAPKPKGKVGAKPSARSAAGPKRSARKGVKKRR